MINVCSECALRLFNIKHHNLQGIGNPYFGICIVIPNVDYDAYKKGNIGYSNQVEIIKSIISSTGELTDVFILPFIRCNETIACELNNDIYNRCLYYFSNDINKYQFKYILLLGDAGRRFLNCDIKDNLNNIFISNNNRYYSINYSPLVKYTDKDKFETFKHYLNKWYNSIKNNDFTNYKILNI